jgi:TonB family protein
MALATAPYTPYTQKSTHAAFIPVIIFSVIIHGLIICGVPFFTSLLYHSTKFERPQTFSLVQMTHAQMLAQKKIEPIVKKSDVPVKKHIGTTPVPKKKYSKPVAKTEEPQQENTDDLNDLLSAIPTTKVSDIASVSTFKYPWYLQNIRSRVEEKWKPPMGLTAKKDAFAVVTFTILASGDVEGVAVSQSSGVATLDNLAMRAIMLAKPFGKLPTGFVEEKLEINYTLYYVKQ